MSDSSSLKESEWESEGDRDKKDTWFTKRENMYVSEWVRERQTARESERVYVNIFQIEKYINKYTKRKRY